jgi:hypothetical protein
VAGAAGAEGLATEPAAVACEAVGALAEYVAGVDAPDNDDGDVEGFAVSASD